MSGGEVIEYTETLLEHAKDVIETLEYHIACNNPENNFFPHENEFVSLNDCHFPSHVDDPLEIIRTVLGDDHANQLEYEDDVQVILDEVEFCRSKLLKGDCRAHKTPEGNPQGKEQDHCENVKR
jgi:hypothetical protein